MIVERLPDGSLKITEYFKLKEGRVIVTSTPQGKGIWERLFNQKSEKEQK